MNFSGERFIPADAGNTSAAATEPERLTVHPRGCGEHQRQSQQHMKLLGSSPRMRGTLLTGTSYPQQTTVHPRGCGEHVRLLEILLKGEGSSPRMRGTLDRIPQGRAEARFIPADAGNTTAIPASLSRQPVHPRGCGEHFDPAII